MEKKLIRFSSSIINFFKKNKIKVVIFTLLILVLIITRFYKLNVTAFFVNDQGRDLKVMYQMLTEKKMTLIGPATSFAGAYGNIYFGPYYYYFMLPFYLLSQNPYFMTALFPMLFIIGVGLLFLIKELKFGQKFIISIFLIFSWFSLYYTRFLWNLNLAFLLSFILFSIFLIFKNKIVKSKSLSFIFGLVAGMFFQIHYGMLFLYVSLPVFFLKRKKNILFYLLGIVISFLPFFIFDIRHQNLLSKNILSYVFSLLKFNGSGLSLDSLLSIFAKIFDYLLFPLSKINHWFKVILAFLTYLYVIIFNLRRKKELNFFFAVSFIIFFLSFFIFKRNFDYYMACFMIWFYFGLGLSIYEQFKKPVNKSVLISLLILFMILNSYKYFSLPVNAFGLAKQNKIVGVIKSDLSKNKTKEFSIEVLPHNDDVNSLEYIMTLNHLKTNLTSQNKYFVCYGPCDDLTKTKNKIFSDKDVSIFKNYLSLFKK